MRVSVFFALFAGYNTHIPGYLLNIGIAGNLTMPLLKHGWIQQKSKLHSHCSIANKRRKQGLLKQLTLAVSTPSWLFNRAPETSKQSLRLNGGRSTRLNGFEPANQAASDHMTKLLINWNLWLWLGFSNCQKWTMLGQVIEINLSILLHVWHIESRL